MITCIDVYPCPGASYDPCVYLWYPSNWYGTGLAPAEPVRAVRPTGTALAPSPSLNLRWPRVLPPRPRLIRSCTSPVRTQRDPEPRAHHHGKQGSPFLDQNTNFNLTDIYDCWSQFKMGNITNLYFKKLRVHSLLFKNRLTDVKKLFKYYVSIFLL